MFGIADDSVFRDFEENELQDPCPRKEVNGRTIYVSQELRMPKEWGAPVLCDFGSAVPGDIKHTEDIQPNIYRAPEVIMEVPWTYSVDIWNVGCMVRELVFHKTGKTFLKPYIIDLGHLRRGFLVHWIRPRISEIPRSSSPC